MAVVNDYNADYPLDFYRFFRDELDCHYIQFTPIVERLSSRADGLRLSSLKQKTVNWLLSPLLPSSGGISFVLFSTNGY